jgi:hypothetical protein
VEAAALGRRFISVKNWLPLLGAEEALEYSMSSPSRRPLMHFDVTLITRGYINMVIIMAAPLDFLVASPEMGPQWAPQ